MVLAQDHHDNVVWAVEEMLVELFAVKRVPARLLDKRCRCNGRISRSEGSRVSGIL